MLPLPPSLLPSPPAFAPPEIVTSDVPRFWRVFDAGTGDGLEDRLQSDYLTGGSNGLAYFTLTKIGGAARLAFAIRLRKGDYERTRARTERAAGSEPAIGRVLARFAELVPGAKIPRVTLVVGRFSSGGTSYSGGIVLGVEREVNAPETLPAVVAHETTHFNQRVPSRGLLAATIAEGMADYVGERVSERNTNAAAGIYGRAHEAELWREWRAETQGQNRVLDWIGTADQKTPRPGDLGYFVGARICAAYVRRTGCSLAALLAVEDPETIVRASGYEGR